MTKTPCKEFADRIVDYVDGELPQDEAQAVTRHLAQCDGCRRTAEALQRSLGLAQVIWRDNLADTTAVRGDAAGATPCGCPPKTGRHGGLPLQSLADLWRRRPFYVTAVAASLLLAAGLLVLPVSPRRPQDRLITAEQIERQVARAGVAAELLAATRIVAQCEGTQSIVERQYRYILREFADTPAAESIKANQNLKLGGIHYD